MTSAADGFVPANATTDSILSRTSVRTGFSTRHIHESTISEIIRCGMAAPSSKNAQPWKFHVVTHRSLLKAIATSAASAPGAQTYVPHDPLSGQPWASYVSTVEESAEILRECGTAIFIENRGVFSRGRSTLASVPQDRLRESLTGFAFENMGIGAAVQNMFVAAHSLGVRGVFMGDIVVAEPAVKELLGMAGDLAGVLALGYSDHEPPARPYPDPCDGDIVVRHTKETGRDTD